MSRPDHVRRSRRQVGARTYERIVVKTQWLTEEDDIGEVMLTHLGELAYVDDLAIVSEKAVIITSGRAIPASHVSAGRLARALARRVRPVANSRGLSIPEKMQYVLDDVGVARVLLATLVASVTRPFGLRGAFYLIAGETARSLDGMRPPLENFLLPPLNRHDAHSIALRIQKHIGIPVAIVDINDRGGSVRAISAGDLGAAQLREILSDNPLGQRDESTPIGLIRRL